jgi:hypothetical protein
VIESRHTHDISTRELATLLGVDPALYQGFVLVLMPSEAGYMAGEIPTMASDTENMGNVIYALGLVLGGLGEAIATGEVPACELGHPHPHPHLNSDDRPDAQR